MSLTYDNSGILVGASGTVRALTVSNTGTVGIGYKDNTTVPSATYALDVSGTMNVNGATTLRTPLNAVTSSTINSNTFPHYSRNATDATQTIGSGVETLVIFQTSIYTSFYTGITYTSSGGYVTGAFRNTSGNSLLVMCNCSVILSTIYNNLFGVYLKISNTATPTSISDYNYIASAQYGSTGAGAISGCVSVTYILPNNYYIGAFVYNGGAPNTIRSNATNNITTSFQLTVLGTV